MTGEGGGEGRGRAEGGRDDQARREITEALLAGAAYPVHRLPPTKDELERAHLQKDLELKERYGNRLLAFLTFQLLVADVVFVLYFIVGAHRQLPEGVIYAWPATTPVELIGIATVVTRYLFPRRDGLLGQAGQPD